jgi:PKD repeat protein
MFDLKSFSLFRKLTCYSNSLLLISLIIIITGIANCTKPDKDNNPTQAPVPTSDFSFSGGGCTAPCQVAFQNNSQNATTYSWDFGDGTKSTGTNPTKTYNAGGAYTVTLTATGAGGSASTSKQVTIGDPKVIADFLFTGGGCTAPCQLVIQNKSQNATSYSWDFGDGTNSSAANPTKTYNVGGTFTITLTATGVGGTAATSKQVVIIPQAIGVLSISTIRFLMRPKTPGFGASWVLPPSCSQTFTLSNIGPAGSKLDYYITASQTPFVTFSNGTGSLQAGQSTVINVDLDKSSSIYTGGSGYPQQNMFLYIHTPGAKDTLLSEEIWFEDITPTFIGTWSGTWSGNSYGRFNANQPAPTSPVNGTWVLNLQTVDLTNNTASGSLTWRGLDKYWVYTYNNGNITSATPQPFTPDRTIQFNSLNTTLFYECSGPGCPCIYRLKINGAYNAPNPSDAFYGPRIDINLNISSKTVSSTGVGFSNSPYNPVNFDTGLSTGTVTGSKQ